MVGTGKGAEKGILFKGGEYLEGTHKVNAVLLDKTGTVTKGKPEVTDVLEFQEGMLDYTVSAESASEHPLAHAIVEYGKKRAISVKPLEHFSAITGHGIEATINGKNVLVGTRKLMKERSVEISIHENKMVELEKQGKTAMLVAIDGQLAGIIAVADTIKENSKGHCKAAVTNALQELDGVKHVEVHLQEGTVDVDYDETKVSVEKLKEAIEEQGYDVK
jgi:P-type Cu+ transporter